MTDETTGAKKGTSPVLKILIALVVVFGLGAIGVAMLVVASVTLLGQELNQTFDAVASEVAKEPASTD